MSGLALADRPSGKSQLDAASGANVRSDHPEPKPMTSNRAQISEGNTHAGRARWVGKNDLYLNVIYKLNGAEGETQYGSDT